MNVIVQSPNQAVEQCLYVQFVTLSSAKAGKYDFSNIGLAIVICIFEVKNLGRGGDKNSAVITRHAGGPGQVVCVDGCSIKNAVVVGVLQHSDTSQVRLHI